MSNNAGAHALLLAPLMASAVYAQAHNADTAYKSHNPLNLTPGAYLQDDYTSKLYDTNAACHPVDLHPPPLQPTRFGWRQSVEILFQYS